MSRLFTASNLRVEQPRRGPFAKSQYRVLDDDGTLLAEASETGRPKRETLRSIFPGKSDLDPRTVLLTSPDGDPLLIVDKREGRELTVLERPGGELVGQIRTERLGRRYLLIDTDEHKVGEIGVDVGHNNFTVTDAKGTKVALVRKRWAGLATHLLTTADRYTVEISDPVPEPLRTFAMATAIAMDMALHEAKDLT